MKQLLLALLLLTLATMLIPGLRERAEPRIDESRHWLGEKLEGPMSPVLTPYRKLKTQTRINEAIPLLIRDRNQGKQPPVSGEFSDYLRRHGLETVDGWGAPLLLEQEPDSLSIISPGPDMEYFTDDDIVNKIRYAEPRFRSARPR